MTSTPVALEDIAHKLGIAVSTVSRALRDLPGIHPTTRNRILEEAKAMGYIAPRKRKHDSQPPRNILTLTVSGEVPVAYLSGMSQASLQFNFSLMSHLFSHAESRHILDPKFQPHLMRMGLVSGIILFYQWPEEVVEALSRKWPTLSMIVQYPNLPVDLIGIDHVSGMVSLIRHLQANGHRQIGFFGLNSESTWARSRFGAYAEALIALELPLDLDNVLGVDDRHAMAKFPYKNDELYNRVAQKINQGVRAWVCADDVIAYSLCAAMLERDIKIPEQVSITGFHKGHFPPSTLPELTTTTVNEEVLGINALRRLSYRLDHPEDAPLSILVPPKFYQGQTTAPEPAH